MNWRDYYLTQGDVAFAELWSERGRTPTLVVVGGGFDPRTSRALRAIADGAQAPLTVVRLELSPSTADQSASGIATRNQADIVAIAKEAGATLLDHPYPVTGSGGRRAAGVSLSRSFHEADYLKDHEEVVIDISGLPRSIFFPLVEGMLQLSEGGSWSGDLHVAVCDSPLVDAAILTEGAEAPGPLGGFAGRPPESPASTVWVPVLGEGRVDQLLAIWEEVSPSEVIPVLPFPSDDARRADDLLLEYRELLFDAIEVEPRNFIYASESNPFDLYRSLCSLYARYQEALRDLGGARFVISTHSSKLLSMGALLAAHEFEMQVQQVSPTRSGLRAGSAVDEMRVGGVLSDLWLKGEPYK